MKLHWLTKTIAVIYAISIVFMLWFVNRPAESLLTSKMAVKQLESSDTSYLAFVESQNTNQWVIGLNVALLVLLVIVFIIDKKRGRI